MATVFVKFPKTGLGNMMFVWARAIVFARLNNIPCVTSKWWNIKIGPYLRNEKRKRMYYGYFRETPYWKIIEITLMCALSKSEYNPVVQQIAESERNSNKLFIFNQSNIADDLFIYIREHRQFIKESLLDILNQQYKSKFLQSVAPCISIHIRRGDFKYTGSITPLSFFIKAICLIREALGETWPVTIFTDASRDEISEILTLPAVSLSEEKVDILDILLMSKSQVLVLSGGSTFSYWAAFLSEAIVIKSKGDWQRCIRCCNESTSKYVEVNWNPDEVDSNIFLMTVIKSSLIAS